MCLEDFFFNAIWVSLTWISCKSYFLSITRKMSNYPLAFLVSLSSYQER